MIDLSMVTSAIVAIGVEATWERAKPRESVIKLLKRFKLDPVNPPTDFDGIYTYTLIEFGIDKPEPILNFFHYKFVRDAFEKAFYKNDPSILDKEAEGIIEWNEETGKLGRIDYDPRREFAAFSAVFHAIVDNTRTPSEVKRDQKLDAIKEDVHQTSSEIIKRLDTLVDLASVRNERNRLVKNTPLDNLAKQMRDWFSTLNYSFENHDVTGDGYFEWIINIPARRGYDRVVVHGVEGEGDVSDVEILRQAKSTFHAKEGWLVANRRVSQAASDLVEMPSHEGLYCYTFDKLLDENADFSGYLDWLENEIKRRGIDRMYVPLACTKEDFDPVTKDKIGESSYDQRNGWIDGYIDRWLDDTSKEHVSILGAFGTGKTWFVLHYAWIALQRYRDAKARGIERPRLPLVIPLRDYAKAVSVESLFSDFFFRKYEIPLPGYSAFEQLNRMSKFLLLFDGFDEMADKVDRQKMINNFWELARVVVPNAKVILTCRTEHFPEATEGRALLNAELQASTANLSGEPPQFEVLELVDLNKEQILSILSMRTKSTVVKQIMNNKLLLDLAKRPVMIELILEAIPAIELGKSIDLSHIYLYAIMRKMERDIKDERTFTSMADKLYFLCELSWEMLSTDQMKLNYRYFPERLRRLFGSVFEEQKDLDHWHYDMMGQTLLIRNADGDYSPAHRSFLEFFVAYKFAAKLGILAEDFTELACEQSYVDQLKSPLIYVWSSYFQKCIDNEGNIKLIPPLKGFCAESMEQLIIDFGEMHLSEAILDFIKDMLVTNKAELKHKLFTIIEKAQAFLDKGADVVCGNIAMILLKTDQNSLRGRELSKINFNGAYLVNANLAGANLAGANLAGANLAGANLTKAIMIDANLQGSKLLEVNLGYPNSWILSQLLTPSEIWVYFIYGGSTPEIVKDQHIINRQEGYSPIINRVIDEIIISDDFSKLDANEILVFALRKEEENILWKRKIHSRYIFSVNVVSARSVDYNHFLTVEGYYFHFNLDTGEQVYDEISPLQTWLRTDLTGVSGISDHNAYCLKLLGAIHVPSFSYDPTKDDKWHIAGLRSK